MINRQSNMATLDEGPADGVPAAAGRNHPFNEPAYGSQSAPYGAGQPQRSLFHGAVDRRCLPSVP